MERKTKFQKRITKGTLALSIALGVSALTLISMLILRADRKACEFICRHFVNAYQAVAGRFFSIAPNNVFEALTVIAILTAVGLIAASIALFCKRRRVASRRTILILLLTCFAVANLYIFSAGFAYNREQASFGAYQEQISKEVALSSYIALMDDLQNAYADIGQYNEDGSVVCPYTDKELNRKIRQAVDSTLSDKFYYSYTPKAKPIVSSGIMTLNRIAGITFLPTCEPGYNKDMPITDRAHTIAHEFAHTKGVMREHEANVVGAYVLLSSGDAFLKYCGYLYAIGYVRELIRYDETYFDNIKAYDTPEGFICDNVKIVTWWWSQPRLGDIGDFFNDLYLKSNGQEEGTGSYEETPSTEEILIGGDGEEEVRYMQVITQYTNMHRMLVGYAQSLK